MSTTTGPVPPSPPEPLLATFAETAFGPRFGRYGWAWSAIWLAYLVDPLRAALRNDDRVLAVLGAAALLAFGALYVAVFASVRRLRQVGAPVPARRRVAVPLAGGALTVLEAFAAGEAALTMTVFLAVMVMLVLPARSAMTGVLLVVAGVEASSRLVPGWTPQDQLGFQVVLTAFVIWGVLHLVQRNAELRLAHQEIARMAVDAERSRFARDLHDILGHSLTVLTVKAELAGRLVRLAPDRAEAEIAEVERLARDALADVRSAVSGYRDATLAGELVAARTALDAAGIEAEVPAAVDEVPGDRRALFGWTVREGVTNVLRHSRATHCRITVGPERVRVEDDGVGPGPAADRHHGLAGIGERARAAGARVVLGRSDLGGFLLEVGW